MKGFDRGQSILASNHFPPRGAPLHATSQIGNLDSFRLGPPNGYGGGGGGDVTDCSPNIAQASDRGLSRVERRPICHCRPRVSGVEFVGRNRRSTLPSRIVNSGAWAQRHAGYYRAPEETASGSMRKDCSHTRDLARLEDENFICWRTRNDRAVWIQTCTRGVESGAELPARESFGPRSLAVRSQRRNEKCCL